MTEDKSGLLAGVFVLCELLTVLVSLLMHAVTRRRFWLLAAYQKQQMHLCHLVDILHMCTGDGPFC